MGKKFSLKAVFNKSNGQINFSLKKTILPKKIQDQLKDLKRVKISAEDLLFD